MPRGRAIAWCKPTNRDDTANPRRHQHDGHGDVHRLSRGMPFSRAVPVLGTRDRPHIHQPTTAQTPHFSTRATRRNRMVAIPVTSPMRRVVDSLTRPRVICRSSKVDRSRLTNLSIREKSRGRTESLLGNETRNRLFTRNYVPKQEIKFRCQHLRN